MHGPVGGRTCASGYSQMSVMREITYDGQRLVSNPVAELACLRGTKVVDAGNISLQ